MSRLGLSGVVVTVIILAIAAAGGQFNAYVTYLVTLAAVLAVLTVSFDVLLGYTGYISLAHGAIFGVGAYALAILTVRHDWSFWLALPTAGMVSALCGMAIAGLAFRTRGLYFGVLTLGIGLVGQQFFFLAEPLTGGVSGFAGVMAPQAPAWLRVGDSRFVMLIALGCLLVTFLLARLFVTSRIGAASIAVREDLVLAKSLGIRVGSARLAAFVFSSFFAGIAGGLYAVLFNFIGPESFGVMTAGFQSVVQVVVGGMGTLWGPIIGTALLVALPELTRGASAYSLLIYGVVMLLVIRFAPQGIAGIIKRLQPGRATGETGGRS